MKQPNAIRPPRDPEASLRRSALLSAVGLMVALLVLAASCGGRAPDRAGSGRPAAETLAALDRESGKGPIPVLLSGAGPGSAPEARERVFLLSILKELGAFLGRELRPTEGEAPLRAGLLPAAALDVGRPGLRLPFMQAREPLFWLVDESRPALAAALDEGLRGLRASGGLDRAYDEAFGPGAARALRTGDDPEPEAVLLLPPPEAAAWLSARRAAGGALRAGIREGEDRYVVGPDGSVRGFDYELALAFARSAGLRLEVEVQKDLASFFTLDGAMPADVSSNESYSYTPDLLRKVDLYAGPFAVVPWRLRLMDMVIIFPTRNQLAGRAGEEVKDLASLDGKRFAVLRDSFQHRLLIDFAKERKLGLDFVFGKDEYELFSLVRDGKADYVLEGSVFIAKYSRNLGGFGYSSFPSDLVNTGWGLKKEDEGLEALLSHFLERSRGSGLFAKVWERTFVMGFSDYMAVLTAMSPAEGK